MCKLNTFVEINEIVQKNPDIKLSYSARIWNLFTVGESMLLFELRDDDTMTAFFDLYDLDKKKYKWRNVIFNESWRVGVSFANEKVIINHQFQSGTIPAIEKIMALETETGKLLWELLGVQPLEFGKDNFLGLQEDKKTFFDLSTGQQLPQRIEISLEEKKNNVQLPLTYHEDTNAFQTVASFIQRKMNVEPVGISEYLETEKNVVLTYHTTKDNDLLEVFIVGLRKDGEIWLHKKLDEGKNLSSDTFFICYNYLIFVEGKHLLKAIRLN